ncbi:unnamed protein product, partial [Owenia fusiformis]
KNRVDLKSWQFLSVKRNEDWTTEIAYLHYNNRPYCGIAIENQILIRTMSDVKSELSIPFPTEEQATIAYNSLRVDKEPKRGGNTRELRVDGNVLHLSSVHKVREHHFPEREGGLFELQLQLFPKREIKDKYNTLKIGFLNTVKMGTHCDMAY